MYNTLTFFNLSPAQRKIVTITLSILTHHFIPLNSNDGDPFICPQLIEGYKDIDIHGYPPPP